MKYEIITNNIINKFKTHLIIEEKSTATIEKYIRDVEVFYAFVKERVITKEIMVQYKNHLLEKGYAVSSINSMLAAVNSLLIFIGKIECKVKNIRTQKQIYCTEGQELTKAEYLRLLQASAGQPQLNLIMQTICSTGIRISELQYFTVEALNKGEVNVKCKGKIRKILIPGKLRKLLRDYTKKTGIRSGMIFITKNGNAVNRSNVWKKMKNLCEKANVALSKVFPHNLRKLFAKTFYKIEKDIAKLADILGHESIDTTRIYIMTTGAEHRKKIERLGLILG